MARRNDSNFKKAVNELFGSGDPDVSRTPVQQETSVPVMQEEDIALQTLETEPVRDDRIHVYNPGEDGENGENAENLFIRRDNAIIPEDMIISGNIVTKSNMKIAGSIVGDIKCEGDIELQGTIQGNVSAGNLSLQSGTLNGDVSASEVIYIEANSCLKGNLTAQNVRSNGRSEGQIQVSGLVELCENAVVQGDITAGALSVETGARIKGMVNIRE
ncbi:MAG: polymer-forming cytoskeletal protein [Lachnospiraceae bacterium]|nr:polymer-forming cytoskeletal protein [Lachnospiraceae bacterium]